MPDAVGASNRYLSLLKKIFQDRYVPGAESIAFEREDLEIAATQLGIALPKNLGDVIYAIRYRIRMPDEIAATQPEGQEWVIKGEGRSRYAFKLVPVNRIVPNPDFVTIKIPDATPEIIRASSLSDEQALLARVRYNRLIDIFLGVTAYSLQNHLRTYVKGVGQIEIDEVYVGIDRLGRQYVFPVQAKGGRDQLSVVQTQQDLEFCKNKYPHLICRAISAQFLSDGAIVMFELVLDENRVRIVEERHYRLVPANEIDRTDLEAYARRT